MSTSPASLRHAMAGMFGAFGRFAGWRGVRAAGLVAAGAVLDGAGLLLLVPILGVVVAPTRSGLVADALARAGAVTPFQQLALLMGAFLAVILLRAATLYARDMALGRLQAGFIEAERNRAMLALAEAPWSRVVGLRHARVTNVITTEIQRLSTASYFMVQGAVLIAILAIQTVIAFSLAPALAAAATILLVLGGAVFVMTQPGTRALGALMGLSGQAMMASASGFLSGLKTAAAQNAQRDFVEEFEGIQRNLRDGQILFQQRQARGRLIFALVSGVLGAAVVLLGFGMLRVSPAILITLVIVFTRMSGPAMQLYQSGQHFVYSLPAFEAVRALEADLRAGGDSAPVAPVQPPPGGIELVDAAYLHASGRGVENATLAIAPGAFVGIAGPSGAGKTTLADLIVGLLEPQAGEVRVGGVALDRNLRSGWAQTVAYVSQEGFLFHDTLRRNLAWANPGVSDASITEALTQVDAGELVARMEEGLDTMIGERGTLLSGGERQRIGLARALLRRPRLLVLDEAANAIDAPGEAALLARLAALDPRPTILMISHREESLKWCDSVIRVEAGRVVG